MASAINNGLGSTTFVSSHKRKSSSISPGSDSEVPLPSRKKARASTKSTKATAQSATPSYTAQDLAQLSHTDLIAHVIELQKQLDASKKSSSTNANGHELGPEDLQKKVEHLRTLMVRQIKKAMTWKPSCKTGSATFSQDFVVQSPQIVKKLFARVIKDNGKDWKMKKLSADDFEVAFHAPLCFENPSLTSAIQETVGSIDASVRYDRLELTSDVTIRWDPENGTMKCSGKYGKPGTGILNMKRAASAESA